MLEARRTIVLPKKWSIPVIAGFLGLFFVGLWIGMGPKVAAFATFGVVGFVFLVFLVGYFFMKNLKGEALGFSVQLIPPDVVQGAEKGSRIPMARVFPSLDMGQKLTEQFQIVVDDVWTGNILGASYKAATFSFSGSYGATVGSIVQVRFSLPGSIGGTVICHFTGDIINLSPYEADLESVDFNRRVALAALPKALAWRVFAPDFMEWYLHTPGVPGIFVNDTTGALLFPPGQGGNREVHPMIERIIFAIMKSGAVEKKTEPSLHRLDQKPI